MPPIKKEHPAEKTKLHPRNRHRTRYDFPLLTETCPALKPFVQLNMFGDESIDFADPDAVKMLNKALLMQYYDVSQWNIPPGYLCPPIPGRADYIHHIADLLCTYNYGKIPTGSKIKCLDIGVGANCVYPIIGHKEYGWHFIGTDIDPLAIKNARKIVSLNPSLTDAVECRLQPNAKDILFGILDQDELVDLTICNPPYYDSPESAAAETLRKLNNLNPQKVTEPILNFGGKATELWCEGGETAFIRNMIRQSRQFSKACFWFSTLVSKEYNLKTLNDALKRATATEIKIIPMGQGNKTSRIVAWTFLTKPEQQEWRNVRWHGMKPKVVDPV